MTNLNISDMKKNIRELLKKKGMTQQELGEKIGMSQSNISKCLSEDDASHCFSVAQSYAIAKCFGMTLDELISNNADKQEYSKETICRFIQSLIENSQLSWVDITVKERIPEPDLFCEETWVYSEKESNYTAFYFPRYIQAKDYWDDDRISEAAEEENPFETNESKENKSINTFLSSFIKIYKQYDLHEYTEKEYRTIIDAFFKTL